MSFDLKPSSAIPVETYKAARESYNLEHVYLRIGDRIVSLFSGVDLALLDPSSSMDTFSVVRQTLVTAFQYAELLPDAAASQATLKRLDWKYALHLPARHPGFSPATLCEFRRSLYRNFEGMQTLTILLERLYEFGLYPLRAGIRPDSVEVLITICQINTLDRLDQAIRNVLSLSIALDPEWLRINMLPHWYGRYRDGAAREWAHHDLARLPDEMNNIGQDIFQLLEILQQRDSPGLSNHPEVSELARLAEEQFTYEDDRPRWRQPGCPISACQQIAFI